MDPSVLIGHSVTHIVYGTGEIVFVNEKLVKVQFDGGEPKRFQFPTAFGTYLQIDDEAIMAEILEEKQIREQEKDRKKAEEAEKTRLRAKQEAEERRAAVFAGKAGRKKPAGNRAGSKATIGNKEELRAYDGRIIDLDTTFATHAEMLNTCFGYHYVQYQKAYKDLGNGYAVWFPRIAKKVAGQYVSSDSYSGWVNILSDSGDSITQMENSDFPYDETETENNIRIIFARFEGENRYRFIGVYANKERIQNGTRFTRIGTRLDTKEMKVL